MKIGETNIPDTRRKYNGIQYLQDTDFAIRQQKFLRRAAAKAKLSLNSRQTKSSSEPNDCVSQ